MRNLDDIIYLVDVVYMKYRPDRFNLSDYIINRDDFENYKNNLKSTSTGHVGGLRRTYLLKKSIQSDDAKKLKEILYQLYHVEGYGLKYIIKHFCNNTISYSGLRDLFSLLNIEIRTGRSVVTEKTKDIRSKIAIYQRDNRLGFFSDDVQYSIKNKYTVSRGIQGYYFNKSINRYVWLRSSWEYIFAKWLDNNNAIWDTECKVYDLDNNIRYMPDFFIYDEYMNLKQIVEIKGYWKNKVYKFDKLKETMLDIDCVIIEEIKFFTKKTVQQEIREWRRQRILNLPD